MSKEPISTAGAPAAIGAYSQAIRSGDLVFCSGQIALDPATGEMVSGGVVEQAEQALNNLKAVLEAAGTSLGNVVKTTVFLASIQDFAEVNEVYGKFFDTVPPARSAVAVKDLPKGALVEVEAIAAVG